MPLPLRPIQNITAIRLYAKDDSYETLAATSYMLDRASIPPRVVERDGAAWPKPGRIANGIEIAIVAGYGNAGADVPAPVRQALLLLIAHWYEHRELVEVGAPGTAVPTTVSELLAPYRTFRL